MTSRQRPTAPSGSAASRRAPPAILIRRSGKLEKISLGPGAAPHGVIIGPDGAPWFTEGGQNAIARVDPATKKVDIYPLPKEFRNANLNTPVFDKSGVLWFTGQNGVHGRFDPKVGKVEAWRSAAPRQLRHHRDARRTRSGSPRSSGDYIGHIDRNTGDVTVVEPPRKGFGPRRVWSDSNGMHLGELLERRRRRPLRPGEGNLDALSDAAEQEQHLRGLCRRQGPRLGDRLARQRDPALRPGDARSSRPSRATSAAPTCAR